MASQRRRNKRKKMMGIYKTTMKIKSNNPDAPISECITTATQLHNKAEEIITNGIKNQKI